MASNTNIRKTRKQMRAKKAGRARKNQIARRGSTPSKAALFGDPTPQA